VGPQAPGGGGGQGRGDGGTQITEIWKPLEKRKKRNTFRREVLQRLTGHWASGRERDLHPEGEPDKGEKDDTLKTPKREKGSVRESQGYQLWAEIDSRG